MFEIPDWLGTVLTGAGSALLTWWFGRKKENADLNVQAANLFKDFSEKMETRVDRLQAEVDLLRGRIRELEAENLRLKRELSQHTPIQPTIIQLNEPTPET